MLVSAAVMDLISGLIDAPIKDLGTLKLRNISRPVHAYAVGAGKRPRSTPAIDSFQRRRPSIAVLPFVDQAAEAATSYFSDGLVRGHHRGAGVPARTGRDLAQLDAALSRHHARSATGPPRPARALHALGQRAARAGHKVTDLSAELTDCESGTRIWSDRFAGEAADLFALQDELVGARGGDDRAAGAGIGAAPRAAQAAGEPRRL